MTNTIPHGPNFFLVGAAKSGTTAMHAYLARHPDIFMSPAKEPSYFASELGLRTKWSRDLPTYLSLFEGGAGAKVRGESSPAYLISTEAAGRIREFRPDAKILILLRNPLDTIQALHSENRKFGVEPKRRLERAVAASDRGRSWWLRKVSGPWTRYREIIHFADQVERYLLTFPREQVHIELYDDLAANPATVYKRILTFLGVDSDFEISFARVNRYAGEVRSNFVQLLVIGTTAAPGSDGLGKVRFNRARRRVARLNVVKKPRATLDRGLRAELVEELRPDLVKLSGLIGRDVTGWLDDPPAELAG